MPKYSNLQEEAVKNKIAQDYFARFDHTNIIGKIDFCIAHKSSTPDRLQSVLWAEAKRGIVKDINTLFVQLILTIGRAKTFNFYAPPSFLGAFDAEKIAFLPYDKINDVFLKNDFNWHVAPSNYETKEFIELYNRVNTILENETLSFYFDVHDTELRLFIRNNFISYNEYNAKLQVDKNSFVFVFQKWEKNVKPSIGVDWNLLNKAGLISADFFLADLLSENNKTLKDKLFILLQTDHYLMDRKIDPMGYEESKKVVFADGQKAHKKFWNLYERPPRQEYWDFIISRRDLLVPPNIRERKGSFFTPQVWVQKSQSYLAHVLGEDWQNEYIIWDCCAGTGNLLNGLNNYRNVWASTLDKADVDVIHDRIENGNCGLYNNHVFQFDFLNDDFSKCPPGLQEVLKSSEKRQKLVIYINPPYAEASTTATVTGTGKHKDKVATDNATYRRYKDIIGKASNELFAQFLIRVYYEIPGCILGQFSTLKHVQAGNFKQFRTVFLAKLEKCFMVPANTFDNVKGQFPIGFFVWNTQKQELFKEIMADVFDAEDRFCGTKKLFDITAKNCINDWIAQFKSQKEDLGLLNFSGRDMQQQNLVAILSGNQQLSHNSKVFITRANIIPSCIYFAVRHCIPASWFNDRDQFLYPNNGWQTDKEFQSNCLIYTLFHGQNRITCCLGTNHWIPFTEEQVGLKKAFKSHFMSDFLAGKIVPINAEPNLFTPQDTHSQWPIQLSAQAQAVFDAGLQLWVYYHSKPRTDTDASFYDIRRFFQGETRGRMNNKSDDEQYTKLITNLRGYMHTLAQIIAPKVYQYGFLAA